MGLTPPDGQIQLPTMDWVTKVTTEHRIALQTRIVTFFLRAFGLLLVAAFAIFLFQGFGLIKLSETVLKLIGGATIVAMGGMLTLMLRSVFGKR